jgi:hypothetical protein
MALVVKDRVRETTTSTGTGTILLNGAVEGFQDFTVIGDSITTYYTIVDPTTNAWEVGIGTYTASGTTLSRDTILESSTGGAAVNFADGTKDVFVTYPAERSVDSDTAQTLTNKTLTSPTITGTGTAAFGNLSYTGTLTGGTGEINIGSGQIFKATGSATVQLKNTTDVTVADEIDGSQRSMGLQQSGGVGPSSITLAGFVSSATAARAITLNFARSNGGLNTYTLSSNGNEMGAVTFQGADGAKFIRAASIKGVIDGTPGTNDMPGRLVFSTTPAGSATPSERMRIDSSGDVGIGTASPSVSGLEISRATGSASPVPAEIRLRSTTNAGDFSLTDPWARVSFFSDDTSSSGPKEHGAIQCVMTSTAGSASEIQLLERTNKLATFNSGVAAFYTVNAERLRITDTGNVGIGTSSPTCTLDVVGGIKTSRTAVTAPAATDGNVFSGTYTPTLTNVTNVASSTTLPCQYMRVGNVVTVSGSVQIQSTTGGTVSALGISLPIASTFTASRQLGGFGGANNGQLTALLSGDATNNRASLNVVHSTTTLFTHFFSFTYQVL